MALFYLPRVVAWDATRVAPAADGILVTTWTDEVGGSQVQQYDQSGNPTTLHTEGFTVPGVYVTDMANNRVQVWSY